MKCTVRNILALGSVVGLLLFVLGAAVASNRIFYYLSGAWVADVYVQGRGEAGIAAALVVGVVSSIAMGVLYIFLFCRFYERYKKNK